MPDRALRCLAAIIVLLLSAAARCEGHELVLRSGGTRVALIELYTSEGCSSCPPADRWFVGLEASPGLWREFVPMAFHVDYWDELGWPDRFAAPAWSDRQREHARAGRVSTVYTPGVFRNGREWRSWPQWDAGSRESAAGTLEARVRASEVFVTFATRNPSRTPLEAHVALLGSGLSTDVRAGENRGRKLRHGLVVLGMHSRALPAAGVNVPLPKAGLTAPRRAVAVWVTHAGELVPLQATGGWLPADAKAADSLDSAAGGA